MCTKTKEMRGVSSMLTLHKKQMRGGFKGHVSLHHCARGSTLPIQCIWRGRREAGEGGSSAS